MRLKAALGRKHFLALVAGLLAFLGYVANIVVLYGAVLQLDHLTGSVILRIIGVFVPPLGAIFGLFF